MRNVDAPHPVGSICPAHGLEAMNIYQGGQHRNYSCTVDHCEFQVYRHPCPVCENYEGGGAKDGCSTTPCPACVAKRTPCQQSAGIHHVPCEHFDGQGHPIVAVAMPYTNHNGDRRERTFKPLHAWYGSTKWHRTPQWFMRVWDVEKQAERDYALFGFVDDGSQWWDAIRIGLERYRDREDRPILHSDQIIAIIGRIEAPGSRRAPAPRRVRIARGWADAGRTGTAITVVQHGEMRSWTVVVWDDDGGGWKYTEEEGNREPYLHKTNGLEPIE